jgi:hypothetical protein
MHAESEINAHLPMNIDSDTFLFARVGIQNKFMYNFQLPNYEKIT